MNDVVLVVGDVSSRHLAALRTAIRRNHHTEPLFGFAPAELADLREAAIAGMFEEEVADAMSNPSIIAQRAATLQQEVTSAILPMGRRPSDIGWVIWGHKIEDQKGFNWLIPEGVAHCIVRMGDDRRLWVECGPGLGRIDFNSMLYAVV